jgi:peptidoglycan/LPS O-acetylase OafA/YrhL
MEKLTRPTIIGLDVVRFFAAFAVMCFHLCTTSWAVPTSVAARIVGGNVEFPRLFHLTWFGWLGVEIFFVLSGVVIAYSAEGSTAFVFLRSRVNRFYPGAWICATLTAIALLLLGQTGGRHLFRQWASSMILSPFPPWIDPVYWTLGIEIVFYAAIFLLLSLHRFDRLELLAWIMGGVSALYWVLGTAFAHDFVSQHLWNRILELSLVSYGCYFATGVMAYIISRNGPSFTRILAIALFVGAGLIEIGYKVEDATRLFHSAQSAYWPRLCFLAATFLIFVSMRFKVQSAHPAARTLRIFGLATYPLYLFHQIIGAALLRLAVARGLSQTWALVFSLMTCVVGSLVIAGLIEPPLQALLRRFFDRAEPLLRNTQCLKRFMAYCEGPAIRENRRSIVKRQSQLQA